MIPIFLLVISFTGCKSLPTEKVEVNVFDILDKDSSLYLRIPVANHKILTSEIISSAVKNCSLDNSALITSNIDTIKGAIRDVDEMTNAGFKALARRLCVGHAYSVPVSWGESVTVFGCAIQSGDLIHSDKHGFMVIPEEDQEHLVESVAFMDENECLTTIGAARQSAGKPYAEILADLDRASAEFGRNVEGMKKRLGL